MIEKENSRSIPRETPLIGCPLSIEGAAGELAE
jgi:hypothetical protein